ncbi:hypothetical protein EV426DRAFT_605683 [Tirmania nivea]|nr:hypothetical protein EV426DRAFT_605683 [Tirmania nivea]
MTRCHHIPYHCKYTYLFLFTIPMAYVYLIFSTNTRQTIQCNLYMICLFFHSLTLYCIVV